MSFIKFTTLAENRQWYKDTPPFDCVLLSPPVGIENVLVSLNVIDFDIEKLDNKRK